MILDKSSPDAYIKLLIGYARSPFRDFEGYLRIVVRLDEDDFKLILKLFNSNFMTFELSPGVYAIKDVSETVYTMADLEKTL